MATNFSSPGASASRALRDYLMQVEAERRQAMLDGLVVDDRMRRLSREEMERHRQARLDVQAADDRKRRIAAEDMARELAPFAPGDLVDDSIGKRYPQFVRDGRFIGTPEQRETAEKEARRVAEREADRQRQELRDKDAAANRYLDTERGYYEAEQKRKFDAAEAAKDRASQERRAAGQGRSAPTQGQLTADTFYSRALDASEVLEDVEGSISQFNRYVPNFLQSEDGQAYNQAKRQFIEAYLRKDSGAAIGKDEYANADTTYFVQPGDSAATVKRKQRARARILESLQHQGSGNGSGNIRPMPSHKTNRRIGRFEVIE